MSEIILPFDEYAKLTLLAKRSEAAEADHAAVLERERIELIEWAQRVDEQFKLRQAAEARVAQLEEKLHLAHVESQSAWDSEAQWKAASKQLEAERDELYRQLGQAQADAWHDRL